MPDFLWEHVLLLMLVLPLAAACYFEREDARGDRFANLSA